MNRSGRQRVFCNHNCAVRKLSSGGRPVTADVLSLNQTFAKWIVFRKLTAIIRQYLGRPQTESVGTSDIGTAHLQYESVEDWMNGENVPMGFIKEPDPVLRDKYIRQYGELRRHLYAKHVATLPREEQRAINDGCHPSQSHRFADDAQPYCEQLERHLRTLGLDVADVHLGWYHMDRIVLTAETPEHLDAGRFRELPWLFQGFEVKYISTANKDATEIG